MIRQYGVIICILTVCIISACQTVEPEKDKNWAVDVHEAKKGDGSELWSHRFAMGRMSVRVEKRTLYESNVKQVVAWRDDLETMKSLSPMQQLQSVQQMVNHRVSYMKDYDHFGKADLWGFPIEALTEGGDCEDYVFLKALSLQYLGWGIEDFYLVVGKNHRAKPAQWHAIFVVKMPNGGHVVLDNMHVDIRTPDQEWYFEPLYAMSTKNIYKVDADYMKGKTLTRADKP
ncbi:MAG: transglutaminase-like cysteine peptidase [Pseudomonadales bacterium]|nr:transglutaminase-like cysteine peptidase [Pseudomonadales bacterium]